MAMEGRMFLPVREGNGYFWPLFEDVLGDGEAEHIRPASIKGEVREDFSCFGLRQAIIHGAIEVIGHLRT